jgi:hypothetical protein
MGRLGGTAGACTHLPQLWDRRWLDRVVHDGRNISGRGDICRHGWLLRQRPAVHVVLSTGFAVKGKKDDTGNRGRRRIRGLPSWAGILHVLQLRRIFADRRAEQQRLSVYAAHARLRQSGWPLLEHGNWQQGGSGAACELATQLHGAVDDMSSRIG